MPPFVFDDDDDGQTSSMHQICFLQRSGARTVRKATLEANDLKVQLLAHRLSRMCGKKVRQLATSSMALELTTWWKSMSARSMRRDADVLSHSGGMGEGPRVKIVGASPELSRGLSVARLGATLFTANIWHQGSVDSLSRSEEPWLV